MSTISDYLQVAGNLPKWQKLTTSKPENATQTKYFQANIGKIKSADDLIKNPRLFNYAMTAFGLGDMIYAKGLMKRVLHEGVDSKTDLANKLPNQNILEFAKAFDFAAKGATTTSSNALVANVVSRYTENMLEADQGKTNPGVQLALYFQQKAPKLTSVYGLLADKNLLTVVQTALDISPRTSAQSVDTQYRMLNKMVKIADFKDPKKLQAFISRFAAMYDYKNGGDGSASSGADGSLGIGQDLLAQLASQRSRR